MLTNQTSVSFRNKALMRRCSVAMGIVAVVCCFFLSAGSVHASIIGTYVDAEALYGSVNTGPTDTLTFFQPGYNNTITGFSDGLWDDRSAAAPSGSPGSFGLNSSGALAATQNVLEAGPTIDETVPTITTTVTGLPLGPFAQYDVYVLYWSFSSGINDWSVRAKLSTAGAFVEYDRAGAPGTVAGTDTLIGGGLGGGTVLYEAKIGTVVGTSFGVNIQNSTLGVQARTEYDGIAYEFTGFAPEPASLGLLMLGAPFLARRRRR